MSKHGAASFLAIGIGFLWIAGVLAVDSLTVSRVIDGDSLLLSNGSQVRLIGIDAPEFKDQSRNQQNARRLGLPIDRYRSFAQKSANFARRHAAGRKVRLEFDEANLSSAHKDLYGRLLAYVYVQLKSSDRAEDEFFLNAEMVRSGHAFTNLYFDFKKKDLFLKLQKEARIAKRGMWKE